MIFPHSFGNQQRILVFAEVSHKHIKRGLGVMIQCIICLMNSRFQVLCTNTCMTECVCVCVCVCVGGGGCQG